MREDPTEKLAERYDREASAYLELWAPVLREAGRKLIPELAGSSVRRILDVGTGVGSLLPDLRSAFPDALILGVDRSSGMLALAPSGFTRAVMDASRLAVADASVDRVLMVFMLFHLEQPVEGLREVRRVLRDGGRVATLTWGGELESKATRVWTDCLDAHGAAPADQAAQARHDSVDTPEKVEELLHAAGFAHARAWNAELVHAFDVDWLLRLRTSLGASKPRFDSLEGRTREICLAQARRRMERLRPEDFVARGRVVYAAASV